MPGEPAVRLMHRRCRLQPRSFRHDRREAEIWRLRLGSNPKFTQKAPPPPPPPNSHRPTFRTPILLFSADDLQTTPYRSLRSSLQKRVSLGVLMVGPKSAPSLGTQSSPAKKSRSLHQSRAFQHAKNPKSETLNPKP